MIGKNFMVECKTYYSLFFQVNKFLYVNFSRVANQNDVVLTKTYEFFKSFERLKFSDKI